MRARVEEGRGSHTVASRLTVPTTRPAVKERFEPTEVTTTIQCGGNRRGGFNHIAKTSGIAWQFGAISTAVWKGALLREVLEEAGLTSPKVREPRPINFARQIHDFTITIYKPGDK